MKKKILIPTDFSNNSWNAMVYASRLYRSLECEFYIMNAFTVPVFTLENMLVPEPGQNVYDQAKEESEKELEGILERIETLDKNSRHRYHLIATYNSPYDAIIETVEKKDIELIVMGTKGSTDADNLFFGSNTIFIMEHVRSCPVLMVPKDFHYRKAHKIVFPTNFKTQIKIRELKYLIEIAKISNASIHIVNVNKQDSLSADQKDNKTLLEEYFADLDYKFHFLRAVNLLKGLDNFVRTNDMDLVALIDRKHSFFRNVFFKSMIEDLGYSSEIPVLVMHEIDN